MENTYNETSEHKTLLDKWRYVMKDITSPDSYIDMSFYYVIAASLQRRVWVGPTHKPIFGNIYCIMVGEPGVGKGLMIQPVNELLRFHKFDPKKASNIKQAAEEGTKVVDMDELRAMMEDLKGQYGVGGKQKDREPNYLIPVAPNNITYEALIEHLQKAFRFIAYQTQNEKNETVTKKYTYHSLCFCLTELGSLLNKHSKTTMDFLIDVYDCVDYTYKTKHCGTNIVTKSCMSFYAGSTPQFMQNAFDDSVLGEGFASRVLFVYESSARFHKFAIPEYNDLQRHYWLACITRIEQLSKLYGPVTYTPEALEFMTHYFEHVHPIKRANTNPKLVPYYERKKLHTIKMALAIHFADSNDMMLTLEDCKGALEFLFNIEKKMHLAMSFGGKNFLSRIAQQVEKFIVKENRPLLFIDLWKEFIGDVRENELKEVLDYLLRTNKIDFNDKNVIENCRREAYTRKNYNPPTE